MKLKKNKVIEDKSVKITRSVVRVFLIVWTITIIFPLVWSLFTSLKTNGEFMVSAWSLPKKLQWGNYKDAWVNSNFSKYFLNSLILSAGTVVLTVIMTVSSAYVVGKFVNPLVKFVGNFYALFMMVPQILLTVPLYQLCNDLKLIQDGPIILVTLMITNAIQGVPFYVFLVTPFIRGINNSILEAAEIDGANQFCIFAVLIIPMVIPAIFMVCLLSFVGIWNEYVMSITFIKSAKYYTLSVGLNEIMNDSTVAQVVKFAALILTMIPILVVYAIFQKPLQEGLSSSDGVKG